MKNDPVISSFCERFGREPACSVSAPGRVNLIGEHTDYNGYPVLPIAIPYSIRAVAAPRTDHTVRIDNLAPGFPSALFDVGREIPPSPPGEWQNYVKAAVTRIVQSSDRVFSGMDILFDGDIPSSAGLSSSSALVIASAMAFLAVNDIRLDPVELAEMMAEGERYVGTQGGGMDQAICLLASRSSALKIDFFPLRHRTIPFPEDHSIVVAHSLIRAAKTENALIRYNRRPAECRLATLLINNFYRLDPPIRRLGDLPSTGLLGRFPDTNGFVEATFPERSYSLPRIAELAGISENAVVERCLMTRSGAPMPEPDDGFLLTNRVRHVISEAARVEASCEALLRFDSAAFGNLMNESHESCRRDYGISTVELDTLSSIMRDSGALGSRLTGAGFGGCAIALVRDTDLERVIASVKEHYYGAYIPRMHPESTSQSLVFAVKPAGGAVSSPLHTS